jgi:hypothetical protein
MNVGLRYGCHVPIFKLDSTAGRLLILLLLLSSGRTTLEVVYKNSSIIFSEI